MRTFHPEGKIIKNTRFNIINLDVNEGSLEKALEKWKKYEIEDYMTESVIKFYNLEKNCQSFSVNLIY